jgi:streptogramin lyase
MAQAGASEILVSSVLRDLVPASGFGFADRGTFDLKGIEGPWHLFAVTSVDGSPIPAPLEPGEASRRREQITPPPLVQRRWGRVGIAAACVIVLTAAAVAYARRPHPLTIVPSSLARVDPTTGKVIADAPVAESGGAQIAAVPSTHEVWVLSHPDQVITVVSADTNAVDGPPIPVLGEKVPGTSGFGIAYGFGRIWVAPLNVDHQIEELEPDGQTVQTFTVPGGTGRLATGLGDLWVPYKDRESQWHIAGVDPRNGQIEVRSGKTLAGRYGVAVGENAVWVSDHDGSAISRFDPKTHRIKTITIDPYGQPSGIGFTPGVVWVSDALNGVVYEIDAATEEIVKTIRIDDGSLAGYQSDVVVSNGSVWVTSPLSKSLVRIDPSTATVVGRIEFPFAPQDMIEAFGSLWVTLTGHPVTIAERPG